MNIYQVIANDIKEYLVKDVSISHLREKHNTKDYPIWAIEKIPSSGFDNNYEMVISRWLSPAAYDRVFAEIDDIHKVIEIYDILCPRTEEYDKNLHRDHTSFIAWIVRSSHTFKGMHDWEPFKHRFHTISAIERIIDEASILVTDIELISSLSI
jgi:hypothetical protein